MAVRHDFTVCRIGTTLYDRSIRGNEWLRMEKLLRIDTQKNLSRKYHRIPRESRGNLADVESTPEGQFAVEHVIDCRQIDF
jgi:hypothetical protein